MFVCEMLMFCFAVKLSLEALKQILPRDLALQVLTRWYAAQNAPGSLNGQSEWSRFGACLLGMMGYDTVPLTVPLNLECVECKQPFDMETMVTQCPACRMVYAVTPCHAHSAQHVQPAGIDY